MEIPVVSKKTDNYSIYIEHDFSGFKELFAGLFPEAQKVCIISDETVYPLYRDSVEPLLKDTYEVLSFTVAAGEASKDINVVLSIEKYLKDHNFSRSDVLIGLGGGVVTDITGFAASLYHRGVAHVFIPTTLLAMADASIGGKNGVDFDGLKNIIGSFKMPSLIYMPLNVLESLPEREFYAGFAEIMKAGLLADSKFYMWLVDNMYEICEKDKDTLATMLETAINIKKFIVEKDPFEKGDRALLNLGHSIGHALESYFAGSYLHGETVALGCVAAAFISWKLNKITMEDYYEVRDMFVPFNLPISIQIDKGDYEDIYNRLGKDKKNTSGSINLVLLKKIGKAEVVKDISKDLIMASLDELNFTDED